MTKQSETAKEISLADFEVASIKRGGTQVTFAADGSIEISLSNNAQVRFAANGNTPKTATAMAAAKTALEIGAKMADGSVFAGLTADGKQQIYAMPADLSMTRTFNN